MPNYSYDTGSLRYLFCHGNHGDVPLPDYMTVEANVIILNGQGKMGHRYEFRDGICINTDGQVELLPAKSFVEKIMKNVSIPSLVLAEVPNHQMGVDLEVEDPFFYINDLRPCTAGDREYLSTMVQAFIPRLVKVMTLISSEYLPGNAQHFCTKVTDYIEKITDDPDYYMFIAMYQSQSVNKLLPQRAVIESGLLYVLKMLFELNTLVRSSLICYY
ncbi:hypothetical protein BJX99DRAFT_246218 [Aspergillus californicus]